MPQIRAEGSLDLTVEVPARARRPGRAPTTITGTIRFHDRDVVVELSHDVSVRGPRDLAQRLASMLDRSGFTVTVRTPRGVLVVLGRGARPVRWQAVATGSRHIRLGSPRILLASIRAPRLVELGGLPVRR